MMQEIEDSIRLGCGCRVPLDDPEYECSVCMNPICSAPNCVKNICFECIPKLTERNEMGRLIHPVSRTVIPICKCGKIWNQDCAMQTRGYYYPDPEKLKACKTPQERMALISDKFSMIFQPAGLHSFVK